MARTVDTSSTLEQWRQNYNTLATEVGDPASLNTGVKDSIVNAINYIMDQYFFFQDFDYDGSDGATSNTVFSGQDNNGTILAYMTSKVLVYKNGLLLRSGTDYTAVNGTSITLTSSASNSDVVRISAYTGSYTATPAGQETNYQWSSAGDIIHNRNGGGIVFNSTSTTDTTLDVANSFQFNGPVYATSTASITGNTTIGGTLGVTGVATFTAIPVFPANTIDSTHYVDGSIDLVHMSANSIDSAQYVDGSIDLAHMSVNSIDSDQYVDGSIDTAHIADNSIGATQINVSGNGTSGYALVSDGDGTFSYSAFSGSNTTYTTSWVDSNNDAILRLTPSSGSADDLTIVAGTGITVTPSGDNLTIASTAAGTTYDFTVPASSTILRLVPSTGSNDDITMTGGTGITVTRTSATELNFGITDNTIDSVHYVDGSIDTVHIADNQVTLAKMAGLARGKIIYGDSSGDPTALTVGSNGQVLKSDGTDISWGTDTGLTTEEVQDIAGGMFSSNTETGITATYQDGDGTIDLVVGTLNQNTTGTAATVTTAAQSNITSLGTLTTLTVDDMTFNGSTISDAGTLTIDTGGDIVLDADGGDISLQDGGAQFGVLTATGSNLIIKSGSTTAMTFANAAVTFADTIGVTGVATFTAVPVFPANTIDSTHYVDGSIDLAHMSANSIDSDQYVDGSIDNAHIADDAINSEHYAAGSIDLEHMASQSVDEDNLYISNAGSNGQFLSKQSGNSGGLTWGTPTDTNTTYSVGDGGLTTNDFTNADHSKLNGIAASATATTQGYVSGNNVSFGTLAASTGTFSGAITSAGDITAFVSDARLKDFQGTIPNALDKVTQLNGYYFTMNEEAKKLGYDNPNRQVGVSAQEIEKVLPEIVKDAPINKEHGTDYKTVQYEKVVPLLIEAIKELKNEVESLKNSKT